MSDLASPPAAPLRELTFRGILLGGLITLLFTAANVYLGLKVGITFATSIPAAVISMAILRFVSNSNILENNIVQTIASAAGTLAAIIFVLPGLIMIGWWQGFPYWPTVAVCAIGGTLGVMFSVPLRRALVTGSDLPYPEGVAAAEVLKVGSGTVGGAEENAKGLAAIVAGSLVSAGFALLAATRVAAGELATAFRLGGGAASGASTSLSMALIGVGHLVGMTVGIAMLIGMLTSWAVLVPWLTAAQGVGADVAATVNDVFRNQVRFIGAGTIGVAAVWTLLKILGPIIAGIRSAMAASKARAGGKVLELTERDLPIGIVGGTIILSLIPIAGLLWWFSAGGPITPDAPVVIGATLVYVLVIGAIIAAVCGYMAGLIGASNSPVSGVGILAVLGAAVLLAMFYGTHPANAQALTAYALFTTAIVFSIATISNDNLQDLKTGQLVGATPWKQQVALVIGVIFGSLVIGPVLNILNEGFGFQGMPGAGPNALAAPQAALISSLANGVLGGDIQWNLIGYGALLGVAVIVIDEALLKATKKKYHLPPLAVGMGIYLPMALTLLIPVGAFIGHLYERWAERTPNPEFAKRMGVLAATGLIVGESLFGVTFAGIVAATGSDTPLALVGEEFEAYAGWVGAIAFAALIAWLYARTKRAAA
ncbi:MAG TPA: oligopeptide transporter, OPT family [Allosphingosinicella sp.]|nr:oligopeptide transporter, OPT family [Allosphingosinicella sp.]